MKASLQLILFSIFLSYLSFSSHRLTAQVSLHIDLKEINGTSYSLNDLKGQNLTVIDFWATWCKPCIKSIPKLIEISDQYKGDEVSFVGINVDSPRNAAKVRPFSKSLGINYPVLLDPDQELYGEMLVSVLPTLFILNDKGEVLYTHEGFVPGDEIKIESQIKSLLSND